MSDAAVGPFLVTCLVYVVIGVVLSRFYFRRRHGVWQGRGLQGIDVGSFGALWVGLVWPVAILVPAMRRPQLCDHEHHVLARDEVRRRHEATRDALVRERGRR